MYDETDLHEMRHRVALAYWQRVFVFVPVEMTDHVMYSTCMCEELHGPLTARTNLMQGFVCMYTVFNAGLVGIQSNYCCEHE